MSSVQRHLMRWMLSALCSLPVLALAYSEKADLVVHGDDNSYLGGPISSPDRHHQSVIPHGGPLIVQESVTLPSVFTPGFSYTRRSAVTFSNQPQPSLQSYSRFEGFTASVDTSTYATASLSYSFSIRGAPGALVPVSIASFFELWTNRPTAFVNMAFAEVQVALTVDNPAGAFATLYGTNSSFVSMRCGLDYNGTSCLNHSGDDALPKTLDGVPFTSTSQAYDFVAVGSRNLRSGMIGYAFDLPLDATGSASVTLQLSATSAAYNGLFDFPPGPVEQGSLHEANGYIDPYISIDPAYLASHPGTQLTVESGLGNTAAVPELPPGALLLGGLAALAGTLRRSTLPRVVA